MAPLGRAPLSIGELADEQYGQVIGPDDAEYDAARAVYAGDVDRRPAVIVRPRNAEQVARVVTLARETGLDLAVRSGGHGPVGHGVCDGGIVLDLAGMKALEIDVEARTAWAETGITAGEYTKAAGEHGLATGFGDDALVGVGGITLGGGVGFLSRKYGMTIDDLLAAEIVTADGELLSVEEHQHPDLSRSAPPGSSTPPERWQSRIMANLSTIYNDAAEADRHEVWAEGFMNALRQSDSGAYVNFLVEAQRGEVRGAVYPGPTWERLTRVKAKYDPGNLFHVNHNIIARRRR